MRVYEDERGAVLLLVLLLLLVLTTVIVHFMFTTRVNTRVADSHIALVKNRAAISGGVAKAMALLLRDQAEEDGEKSDSCHDVWAAEAEKLDLDGTLVRIIIEDEQGKLNLNGLAESAPSKRLQLELGRLLEDLGHSDADASDIMHSLADWLDEDSDGEFEENSPNAKLTDLSEIFRIPQLTDAVLYGHHPESPDDVEKERGGLLRYVTIWGTGRVNLNTATAEVIAALSEEMDLDIARGVVQFRKDEGASFAKASDLLQVGGVTETMVSEIRSRFCTKSQYYTVLCFAETNGVRSVGVTVLIRDGKGCRAVRTFLGNPGLWRLYKDDLKDEEEEEVT